MDNADLVARFRVPVLLVLGDQDRTATADQMRALAAELPEATVSIYPATGHSTFAEQPARFNRELAGFAARVQPGVQP
jgi:pimeloyl-ACP methyl ester carboxylesterase